MSNKLVYLAGPISGQSYDGATNWREYAHNKLGLLSNHTIVGLDPMRHKDYLLQETSISDQYTDKVMSSQRGITARDRFDCMRADVVIINFETPMERVSIGTVMEIAWADANRKPIVLIMKEGNIHDHAMIRECCPFRVDTLDEAIDVVIRILKE